MPNDQKESEGSSVPAEVGQTSSDDSGGNSAAVDQVFSIFKDFREKKLEDKGKQIEQRSKLDKEVVQLKFKGNQKQFELNAELDAIFESIETESESIEPNLSQIKKLSQEGRQRIRKRQKLIKIADKSRDGWQVVAEYESNELASGSQVVKIEDSLSEPLPLKAGVPQGSILGPVLFTLYVNDLLQVPKRCRALGYVDDTKVFMALPSSQLPEAVATVNQDLRDISSWCCAHSLLINPDKTKLIFVGVPQLTRSISTLPPVMLLGKQVKPSTVTKDLGVHIGLETYTEIYFSVTFNLIGKNSEGLTVFMLEFDDVMVKQPKTTGYEFFILHDIDNIDN